MKKKILFIVTLCIMLICMLAIAVSAESVHNASTVNYDETVTLDDGTVCNLFDENGNALIWFRNGGVLQSIRADDTEAGEDGNYVDYITPGNGYSAVANIEVHIGATKIEVENIVVLNLMDDDINTYFNNSTKAYETGNATFKTFVETFNSINKGATKIEYAYLRHDTIAIGASAFAKCYKLKYVNFEDLTELTTIGPISSWDYGWAFYECTALFSGGTLDLSKTKLVILNSGGTKADGHNYKARSNFYGMTMTSVILPPTLQTIGVGTFYNCTSLKTISLGAKITLVDNAAFYSVPLEQIFFYGTLDKIDDLVACTSTTENGTFLAVLGADSANTCSYSNYIELTEEEKKDIKLIYEYSFCQEHDLVMSNTCVGICRICEKTVVNHVNNPSELVTINYGSYTVNGTKIITCQNDGCTYNVTEETPALFTCLGYSAPEDGRGGIAIGFTVSNVAIAEYEEATGKTLKYGAFAVLQSKLKDKDVFAEDGTAAEGVISAEITNYQFVAFELKIVGFTDEQKDTKLAMGAYVAVTDGEKTEYSYMQSGTPNENEKYCFVSYNDIIGKLPANEEVTQ